MSLRFVITGATGFIGAALLARLLEQGSFVTVLSRRGSDRTRLAKLDRFDLVQYDGLDNPRILDQLTEQRPDVFIHCAWKGVGNRDRNEAFQIQENLPLTLHTVELATRTGCRQWIGLGSQAEYGNPNRRIDESCPLLPTTLYGKAKAATGIAALGLCEAYGLTGTWLRVFSTYGPGDSGTWVIPYAIREMLHGRAPELTLCEQHWDFLYVDDAAAAIAAAANGTLGGVFNLGSGSSRPLKDYIEAICCELPESPRPQYGAIPYRTDQVMHLESDVSRLHEATGWSSSMPLEAGIRATVKEERTRIHSLRD